MDVRFVGSAREAAAVLSTPRPRRFRIIYLEITNACNFTCDYCPIDQQTRKKIVMPKAFAESIIDQIVAHDLTDYITFHLMGEPYLHKDLAHLTRYAEDRGIKVRLLTNGSLLEPARNRALFDAGLSHLEIGFRTPNDSSFNKRLRGGHLTLDEYVSRVKQLLEDKVRLGAATEVSLKFFIRSRAAELKLAEPYEHLTSLDDNLTMARTFRDHVLEISRSAGGPTEEWAKVPLRVVNGSYAIYPGVMLNWSRIQDFWVREQRGQTKGYGAVVCGCTAGFRHNFGILASGEVTTCCVDYDGKNIVGDLRTHSLMDVLQSKEAERVKLSLERFRPPTAFCSECKGGPTMTSSLLKQVGTVANDIRQRLAPTKRIRSL
ncbi:MAG: radical SAM/SPASM domain-containing protein [Acidobacteriota bacterium]